MVHLPLGTRVAGQPTRFCGQCGKCQAGRRNRCRQRVVMGVHTDGAYAEYVVWPAANLYPLPAGLSLETGALAEPLSIALHAVGLAHIRPRDTVFIAGAGSIGLLVLAMLRQAGVGTIAISDVSDARLAVAQEMGADVTINPRREAPRQVVAQLTAGNGVDLAFEAVGLSATAQQTLAVTRNKGTVVWIGNNVRTIEIDMQAIVTGELSVLGSYGTDDKEFQRALDVLAGGQIPVERLVNRRASLAEGPELFEQLLAAPETIKCMITL